MGESAYIHLEDCEVVKLTEMAAYIHHEDGPFWIPFSQMAPGEADKLDIGDEGVTISITEWMGNKLGIES